MRYKKNKGDDYHKYVDLEDELGFPGKVKITDVKAINNLDSDNVVLISIDSDYYTYDEMKKAIESIKKAIKIRTLVIPSYISVDELSKNNLSTLYKIRDIINQSIEIVENNHIKVNNGKDNLPSKEDYYD